MWREENIESDHIVGQILKPAIHIHSVLNLIRLQHRLVSKDGSKRRCCHPPLTDCILLNRIMIWMLLLKCCLEYNLLDATEMLNAPGLSFGFSVFFFMALCAS